VIIPTCHHDLRSLCAVMPHLTPESNLLPSSVVLHSSSIVIPDCHPRKQIWTSCHLQSAALCPSKRPGVPGASITGISQGRWIIYVHENTIIACHPTYSLTDRLVMVDFRLLIVSLYANVPNISQQHRGCLSTTLSDWKYLQPGVQFNTK
jgi:hypothetical protein